MSSRLILASQSAIRRKLLQDAGIACEVQPADVDEAAVKAALVAKATPPDAIADALAELKALKVSECSPQALVIGCDQLLDFAGHILSKPDTVAEARAQLSALRGQTHRLLSATVICQNKRVIWRHMGIVQLQMREVSDSYLDEYIARNWESIRHSVGGYKLEEEGVRLFQTISGDFFHVLGLPLIEIISFLISRKELEI